MVRNSLLLAALLAAGPALAAIAPKPPPRPTEPAPSSVAPTYEEDAPLPPVTRERLSQCGVEWNQMKRTGAAAGKTWKSFARVCYPGK